MEGESSSSPLLVNRVEIVTPTVTRYRWVILGIFSVFSFLQSGIWDTWGPISVSATKAIGFTPHDYDLLSNWAPIGIMTTMPFFIWLMNKTGARWPVIVGGLLVAVGTGVRCLPLSGFAQKFAIHTGQLLSAMAGCPVLGAAPLLSNTWFPPSERILATSCMLSLGNMGNAFSFLIGPAIVERPNNCSSYYPNSSTTIQNVAFTTEPATSVVITTACVDNTDKIRQQINYYLYGEFAFAVLVLISIVVFFQNKPATPPSISAGSKRLDILAGLKTLSKRFSFWAFISSFSLVVGAYYGWYGIVTVLLTPHNVSETEVGHAAFVMTLVGTAVGISVGWFADRMKGRIKWILFACYCTMFIVFLCLTMMIMGWIPAFKFSETGFWITFIILGSISNVIQPLAMEQAADIAYPVSEGTSTSIVAFVIMLSMFIFLLILNAIQDQDIANYLFLAFTGLAAPILVVSTRNENVRLMLDKGKKGGRSIVEENTSVNGNDFQY